MHSLLMVLSFVGALCLRLSYLVLVDKFVEEDGAPSWSRRWSLALGAFLLPPLLILTMAIAILTMGSHGYMLGHGVGFWGYAVAILMLLWFSAVLLWQSAHAACSHWRVCQLPFTHIQGLVTRRLESQLPFAACVGFWRPVLIVSQGLEAFLSESEVSAVLCHEQAHLTYRDTFWFFWLGWLRMSTVWLPGTALLWDELLLLREMRADRWAAQSQDPLILAESLLKMAQASVSVEPGWVMFSEGQAERLEQRIEALLAPAPHSKPFDSAALWVMVSLAIATLPMLTNFLHSAA